MFTGLIQDVGNIQSVDRRGGGVFLTVSTRFDLRSVKVGDSIAVEGACLTVVKLSGRAFTVEVSPETLRRTTLAQVRNGQPVNLEKALKMSDPLGGHLVSGHVDGTGEIAEVAPRGNALWYRFRVSPEISHYLVEKGSVAVDGISLTVAGIQDGEFSVAVIPHTAGRTTLGKKKAGDKVNVEIDQIAKYAEKFLRPGNEPLQEGSRIDATFLAKHGFIK